jgi:hypothetical protein
MPPRPLHRWKSFWLGVFVVIFLGWAWARSMERRDYFGYGFRKHELAFGASQMTGTVGLWISDGKDWISGLLVGNRPLSTVIYSSHGRMGRAYLHVRIDHWHIILLFLLPWTTWLVWRVHWMKRLAVPPGSAGLQTGSNGP